MLGRWLPILLLVVLAAPRHAAAQGKADQLNGNPAGRDVYCQQNNGRPDYGPYRVTGRQIPCGPAFQRQQPQSPTPLPSPPPITGCWTGLPDGKLCVENGVFREPRGNAVMLRGVNLAGTSKVPPFLPLPAGGAPPPLRNLDTSNFDFLRNTDLSTIGRMSALGFNVIRLIFVWEAYEPVEGQRNQRYIEMLRAIIREAWRHHIYTLLDFHQDGYARFLAKGCGEGFPRWTIPQFPGWVAALGMAGLDAPDNSAACADWMMKAFADPKVHLSFQALYHSTLIQRYTEVVGDLVSRLGNEPGVIGFDPLNEPFSALGNWDPNYANAFRSPSPLDRILPDLVTRQRLIEQELSNFYQGVANIPAVRNSSLILFLEPNLLVDTGLATTLQRPQNYSQIAYAPHYYEPDTTAGLRQFLLPTRTENAFENMQAVARAWNVPLFLGEFGGAITTGNVQSYMNTIHDQLNRTLASGAQWSFTPGWTPADKDGWNGEDFSIIAQGEVRPALFRPRPYPQEISGIPVSLQVSYPLGNSSRAYTLDFAWRSQATQTNRTVFFLPQSAPLARVARSGGPSQAACIAAVNPFGNPSFERMIAACLGQASGGALSIASQPDGALNCRFETDHQNVVRLVCQVRDPGQQVRVSIRYDGSKG